MPQKATSPVAWGALRGRALRAGPRTGRFPAEGSGNNRQMVRQPRRGRELESYRETTQTTPSQRLAWCWNNRQMRRPPAKGWRWSVVERSIVLPKSSRMAPRPQKRMQRLQNLNRVQQALFTICRISCFPLELKSFGSQ